MASGTARTSEVGTVELDQMFSTCTITEQISSSPVSSPTAMAVHAQQYDFIISFTEIRRFIEHDDPNSIEDDTWDRIHRFLRQFHPDITLEKLKEAKQIERTLGGCRASGWWLYQLCESPQLVDTQWLWNVANPAQPQDTHYQEFKAASFHMWAAVTLEILRYNDNARLREPEPLKLLIFDFLVDDDNRLPEGVGGFLSENPEFGREVEDILEAIEKFRSILRLIRCEEARFLEMWRAGPIDEKSIRLFEHFTEAIYQESIRGVLVRPLVPEE
ncbi:hypothetical protein PV11_05469 [Exophiala sideris]|uniref:Uncharacterized protein n=1 Tax=Exophiala sideris TaxID=1016849 RepID=A0A0D1W3X1_9EURO|nr:hypothetical protein PV11_05469 [Exophiala sideris]